MSQPNDKPGSAPGATEVTPLRVPGSTGISHVLRQPDEHLLVIRPIRFFPILGGLAGSALVLAGACILATSGHPAGWFLSGVGALFVVACGLIAVLGRRFEFDRRLGVLRVRRLGSVRLYPLTQIRAVQLIHGGWYGGGDRPQFHTYQFNLVLVDADQSRMNITNAANWPATWQMACALATFLGVPLADEISRE